MSDIPRQSLRDLLSSNGMGVCDDAARFETLLLQECPRFPLQVQLLSLALKRGIVADIAALPESDDWALTSAPVIHRLEEELRLPDRDARWVLDSWAVALSKRTEKPALSLADLQAQTPLDREVKAKEEKIKFEAVVDAKFSGTTAGALTGIFVGLCAVPFARVDMFSQEYPTVAAIAVFFWPIFGLFAGACLGWVVGPWAGPTHKELAGGMVGGLLGALAGLVHYGATGGLIAEFGQPAVETLLRMIVGIILGLVGGVFVGVFHEVIRRRLTRHGYRDPFTGTWHEESAFAQEVREDVERREGI